MNIGHFVQLQVVRIREGGPVVLLRKLRKLSLLLLKIPELLLAIPLVLAARALRPVMLVRFGRLNSERIGQLAFEAELYLCERDVGMHGRGTLDLDLFYHAEPISNQQLRTMFDRVLRVSQFARAADWLNRLLPGYQGHVVPVHTHSHKDPHWLLDCTPPHISFTPSEELAGAAALRQLGVPKSTPFVCFIHRDAAYLNAQFRHRAKTWRHHDYRNSSVRNYLAAAEELARRGYFAIRMGAAVEEELEALSPRVIDYATKARTEFLDVYLAAKCRFLIAGNCGFSSLAWIFRKPVVAVNIIPFTDGTHGRRTGNLFIPKKCWLVREKRFMSFGEILGSPVRGFYHSEQYTECGIEVVQNTEDEITAVAVEMDERLTGAWCADSEDEKLQARFWSLIGHAGPFEPRVGAAFLRENRDLLA